MSNLTNLFMVGVAFSTVIAAAGPGIRVDDAAKVKKLTADDVIKLWSREFTTATEFGQVGGSPKQSPSVAAYSFRVVGPTFGDLWNHYAALCGVKQRYAEKSFLITADTGPKGSFVVSDRAAADGKGGRGLSVFLLKTDAYTVTVTFQPDASGKSISGSLSAVVH